MDPEFDVGSFAPGSATVNVRLTRNVQVAEAGTQFEILFSPANLSDVDGMEMWVDVDNERTDEDDSGCVVCMTLINWI